MRGMRACEREGVPAMLNLRLYLVGLVGHARMMEGGRCAPEDAGVSRDGHAASGLGIWRCVHLIE